MSLAVLLLVACSDTLVIDGTLEDASGAPWTGRALVEVVTWEVWTGDIGNDEGYYTSSEVEGDTFSLEVPPGHYAVVAGSGTCSGQVELTGAAGEVLAPTVAITCVE